MIRLIFQNIGLTLLFCLSVFSQPMIEVFTGINYPVIVNQDIRYNYLEKFWKPSLGIGFRSDIQLTESINLSPSVSYNHYLYNGYYHEGAQIEEVFVASSGESSDVLRILADLRLIDRSEQFLNPYIEIGVGYVYENIGSIHGRMEYLGQLEYQTDLKSYSKNYFTYTVSAGGLISLSSYFRLDLSAKYYSNIKDRAYLLLNLGIAYKIFN